MKYFEFLIATGANVTEAITTLKDQIRGNYADKQCQLSQVFIIPELIPLAPGAIQQPGRPAATVQITAVGLITEEPPADELQRVLSESLNKLKNDQEFIKALGYYINGWAESIKMIYNESKQ